MGTSLSSPKEAGNNNGYCNWSQQLRTSKSTFSLKTERAATAGSAGGQSSGGGGGGGILRSALPSSISFRNLSLGQASFGRRSKDKSSSQQGKSQQQNQQNQQQQQHHLQSHQQNQQQNHHQQHQHQSIATISNLSNDGAAPSLSRQQQQQQLPAAPWKSHTTKSGLTKSTSCYAFKATSGGGQRPSATAAVGGCQEEKENATSGGQHADSRRLLVQASTSDLLKCVAAYLRQQCPGLNCEPSSVVAWIRSVDRSLILQGWADMAFVNPPNLVFFYLLVKAAVKPDCGSERQLQATLLTCLYVAYSYMGNEISYPLKPFLIDGNRAAFWDRCISLAGQRSGDMLRLNSDPAYFIDVFTELKSYA